MCNRITLLDMPERSADDVRTINRRTRGRKPSHKQLERRRFVGIAEKFSTDELIDALPGLALVTILVPLSDNSS